MCQRLKSIRKRSRALWRWCSQSVRDSGWRKACSQCRTSWHESQTIYAVHSPLSKLKLPSHTLHCEHHQGLLTLSRCLLANCHHWLESHPNCLPVPEWKMLSFYTGMSSVSYHIMSNGEIVLCSHDIQRVFQDSRSLTILELSRILD